MKRLFVSLFLLGSYAMTGCGAVLAASGDTTGPMINNITTSSQGFSIDCTPISITVTARITDPSGISRAQLWYRVGTDQPYASVDMAGSSGGDFNATVKGSDLPLGTYGVWEFYVTAQDKAGNASKSAPDTSVQFLPCVSH